MEDLSYIWSVRQTPEGCEALHEKSKARVRVEDELTECFEVQQGERKRCQSSCMNDPMCFGAMFQ